MPTPAKRRLAAKLRTTETPKTKPLRDIFNWRPQARQAEFLAACGVLGWFLDDRPLRPPKAPFMGYGGAAGGGKSDTFLALALIMCYAFPGAKVSYFRREYTELEGPEGAIERSHTLFTGIGSYNQQQHRWNFPNGSGIYFRHLHTERDKYKYQSQAFHVLMVDEATHFSWSAIDYLVTRNRCPNIPELTPFAAFASNPGNIGHAWYSSLFDIHDHSGGEDGAHQRTKHRLTLNGKYEDIFFVPARLEDNEILRKNDPDYERKLESREGDLAEALRWGNWQVFAGQAFRAWRRDRHVMAPVQLPAHWPKWRAIDWGYAKPFSCHWLTRDPDTERIYVYREVYGAGFTDRQQARMVRDMTPPDEQIVTTFADPSMWETKNFQDLTYTTAAEYAAEGVILAPADNDRLGGKRKIDRLLANLPDGRPGLVVFENCQHLIRTMPLLVYDDTRTEDVNTEQEDHAYDSLRYGLTNYRLPAVTSRKPDEQKNPLVDFGGSFL